VNYKKKDMKKEKKQLPTEGELEILEVLWKKKGATVREVYDVISENKKTAYTTTLKVMQKMTAKGLIRRTVKDQVHTYHAAIEESLVRNSSVKDLINKFFKGSYTQLALHALGHSSGDEHTEELIELINKLKQKKH
jgi:BlaI family penicillinase repressor